MMFYFSSKSAARGFRNFQNYRPVILFHCGRLDLLPRPEIASATLFQEELELVTVKDTRRRGPRVRQPSPALAASSATTTAAASQASRDAAHASPSQ